MSECRVIINTNGIYEGELENGKRHGKGKYTYSNGDEYDGEWENDMRHGKGKHTYEDGGVYEGQWQNGERHGEGMYTYWNGSVYDGEWENGEQHGEGVYEDVDGSNYDGNWQNGLRHGEAMYFDKDGNIYKGVWYYDIISGKEIKIIYTNGSVYKGEWKNRRLDKITEPEDILKHGEGIYISKNGCVYQGQWQNDKKYGEGIYTYIEGFNHWEDDIDDIVGIGKRKRIEEEEKRSDQFRRGIKKCKSTPPESKSFSELNGKRDAARGHGPLSSDDDWETSSDLDEEIWDFWPRQSSPRFLGLGK